MVFTTFLRVWYFLYLYLEELIQSLKAVVDLYLNHAKRTFAVLSAKKSIKIHG
jgi:hypothetical protein